MYRYMKLFGFVVFFLFLGIAQVSRPVWGSRWSRTGNLNQWRKGYAGVLFTDGKFMIAGCYTWADTHYDIFDPATGTWTLDLLPIAGGHHPIAILLPSGEVLYATNTSLSYYLYNQVTGWSPSSVGTTWSPYNCATLLKDGDVLLIYNAKDCVLYDYATDGLTPTTGSLSRFRDFAVEVLLPDGKVLTSGSIGGGDNTSELYDPVAQSWTYTTGNMAAGRYGHVSVLLPHPWNEVLIAGGSGGGSVCELYTPGSQSWTTTGPLNLAERYKATMVLLPSGKALIIGGQDVSGGVGKTCETYNPDATAWTREDDLEFDRKGHVNAVVLQTGKVLVSGGQDNENRAEIYDPSEGMWATKPVLNHERAAHTVTPLPIIPTTNCSTNVLIVGGENPGALKSCELYNYCEERVTLTDELTEARSHHTAVLLVSGQVLVAGGKGLGGNAISSSEIYTAGKPGNWTTTAGAMTSPRFDHSAALLKDGRVLVTGGENGGAYLSSCEIYNAGNWTPTPVMGTPRARHTAVMLLNGNILVIGGQTTGGATATCELWNGAGWTGKAGMGTARYWHTATLLQSGKVLVAGGTSNGSNGLTSCEIYDPDFNSWTTEGNLNTARYLHNTTLLYSGLVLVTGGNGSATSCEIWDPAAEWDEATSTHKWKVTTPLSTGREYHSSVLIPDTMPFILAIGGKSGGYLNSIEEYDVGLGYRRRWQSEITSHSAVTQISPSMHISGKLFRGVSEADGGNYSHIVNSDHPIMSFVRIGGGNWQGNGGGEVMYIPQSSSWSDIHTVVNPPANIAGYYRLWSIVNGIPCKWCEDCALEIEESEHRQPTTDNLKVSVYPNPATTKASIKFRVHDSQFTTHDSRLTIYDLGGRLVHSLPITDNRTPNTEITWDGRNDEGKKVQTGVYFYRVTQKDSDNKGKFIILK